MELQTCCGRLKGAEASKEKSCGEAPSPALKARRHQSLLSIQLCAFCVQMQTAFGSAPNEGLVCHFKTTHIRSFFGLWILHVCVQVYVHMHVDGRGQCWMSSSVIFLDFETRPAPTHRAKPMSSKDLPCPALPALLPHSSFSVGAGPREGLLPCSDLQTV